MIEKKKPTPQTRRARKVTIADRAFNRATLGEIERLSEIVEQMFSIGSIAGTYRTNELLRATISPISDLFRSSEVSSLFDQSSVFSRISQYESLIRDQFTLPTATDLSRFTAPLSDEIAKIIRPYEKDLSSILSTMESMQSSWLNTLAAADSILGFTRLQGIGHALNTMPAFGPELTESLRLALGDWTKSIRWSSKIFSDPLARTSFYAAQGLDPNLTLFPPRAFDEILTESNLQIEPIPIVEEYAHDYGHNLEEDDDEEDAFLRTNEAHDVLQRFEIQLRRFIDERMTAAFGSNWIRYRVNPRTQQAWVEKRQNDIKAGREAGPLIAYADFNDYVRIITRRDNWTNIFEEVFQVKTSVEESFRRLHPIRICTMHARPITQDDELFLRAEVVRIRRSIGI